MRKVQWDIRRKGRAWRAEAMARYALTPEKIELIRGKLLWSEQQRLTLLALLLENVGIDKAVRLGDRAAWRAAIADLKELEQSTGSLADDPLHQAGAVGRSRGRATRR